MIPFNVQRQNKGREPTRFGIVTKYLKKLQRRVLMDNQSLKKYAQDDDVLFCVFYMESHRSYTADRHRIMAHPNSLEIMKKENVIEQWRTVNWPCVYCKKTIRAEIGKIDKKNLTCEKCYNYYLKGRRKDDKKMINAAVEFTDLCRRIILENHKKTMSVLRSNAKSSS